MTSKIIISAPGKLMLLGEHAVLYGKPCIVTTVGQRMKATVELINNPTFELDASDVMVTDYKKGLSQLGKGNIPKGAMFVEMAVLNFWKKFKFQSGLKITTKSEFSSQFGFGSSSASIVCVIKALSELTNKKLSDNQIFDLSYGTVLNVQGKGSGFDVAAAIYGGTLYYISPGKIIKPLTITSLPLIVGYSGVKVDTVTLVNEVNQTAKKYPQVVENTYTQIEGLVRKAKIAILNKDWQVLGELMNINEAYLSILGVEGKKLAGMIYAARDAGAYGAKLSGAGIGDCMIALASNSKTVAIKSAIAKAGGQIININTNVEGVRIDG